MKACATIDAGKETRGRETKQNRGARGKDESIPVGQRPQKQPGKDKARTPQQHFLPKLAKITSGGPGWLLHSSLLWRIVPLRHPVIGRSAVGSA